MPSDMVIDVTAGFSGDVLPPVSIDDATHRILAYCARPLSGWAVYDLAGMAARAAGQLDQVTAWSLLYVNALNGRVDIKEVAAFNHDLRRDFANLISEVPENTDLHAMAEVDIAAVVRACQFGFRGAWAPKMTKLGALYRPHAIPVLDGHVAMAFGFAGDAFTNGARRHGLSRDQRIDSVVRALARYLRDHRAQVAELRARTTPIVTELAMTTDLRLLDMVVWTAQDDRTPDRRVSQGPRWRDRKVGVPTSYEDLAPVPLAASSTAVP